MRSWPTPRPPPSHSPHHPGQQIWGGQRPPQARDRHRAGLAGVAGQDWGAPADWGGALARRQLGVCAGPGREQGWSLGLGGCAVGGLWPWVRPCPSPALGLHRAQASPPSTPIPACSPAHPPAPAARVQWGGGQNPVAAAGDPGGSRLASAPGSAPQEPQGSLAQAPARSVQGPWQDAANSDPPMPSRRLLLRPCQPGPWPGTHRKEPPSPASPGPSHPTARRDQFSGSQGAWPSWDSDPSAFPSRGPGAAPPSVCRCGRAPLARELDPPGNVPAPRLVQICTAGTRHHLGGSRPGPVCLAPPPPGQKSSLVPGGGRTDRGGVPKPPVGRPCRPWAIPAQLPLLLGAAMGGWLQLSLPWGPANPQVPADSPGLIVAPVRPPHSLQLGVPVRESGAEKFPPIPAGSPPCRAVPTGRGQRHWLAPCPGWSRSLPDTAKAPNKGLPLPARLPPNNLGPLPAPGVGGGALLGALSTVLNVARQARPHSPQGQGEDPGVLAPSPPPRPAPTLIPSPSHGAVGKWALAHL
ncbi:unnamed protein product [Caretta caretta]